MRASYHRTEKVASRNASSPRDDRYEFDVDAELSYYRHIETTLQEVINMTLPEIISGMKPSEIITACVAVYGAILATYTQLKQWKQSTPRIRVRISHGFTTSEPPPYGTGMSDPMIILEALNIGMRSIWLSSFYIGLPDKTVMIFPYLAQGKLPCELPSEKSLTLWVGHKEAVQQLKAKGFTGKLKIRGIYGDQVGRRYKSKGFTIEV
ncbi:MAG: hypothetical protein AB1714_23825 [Acidobacteriota bacterium]